MPLPLLFVVGAETAGPWIVRMFVRWAWGPLIVGIGMLLKSRIGLFIATAFVWLGINFATLNLIIEPALTLLRGATTDIGIGGGGTDFVAVAGAYAGLMNLDKAVTMIISAVVTKHALLKGRLFLFKRGVGA